MKKIIYIISVVAVVFSACKKDEKITVDQGYDYFPLKAGHTIIYDVDSIIYNDFTQTVDTFQFQIKELIESVYTDGQGREAWRLERYKKTSDSTGWEIKQVWTALLTNTTAEKVEENQRFIKLTFPIRNNKTWDGNSYNNLAYQEYRYTAINEPAVIGNINFEETTQVLQGDDENLIQKFYAEERYARNVGLVYKEIIDVKKAVTQQIISGSIYRMRVSSYSL